jgi:hypothetical protein
MGPIAVLKKQGKGKARAGGMEGLSIREQRDMSGTPDPVFNPVREMRWHMIVDAMLIWFVGRD